ncbi:hypothetical protein HDV00_002786 [Rhizophlyctis rosea]|nr:hypothetical protein HDV00_002786 [Rhizophlyctis rosea]
MASLEKQHILNIRKRLVWDEAVNSTLSQDAREMVANLQSQYNTALQRLSTELYSKETHFIFELLQNFDDNQYAHGVSPIARIKLLDNCIVTECNEIGFRPENVEAICKTGGSTKSSRELGYIGEKGIGFKSVFTVASQVYIYSNNYVFRFDDTKPLGMIAPEWVDTFPVLPPPGMTSFYLRFRKGVNRDSLQQQILQIHPNLLLFLRTVRELELHIGDYRMAMRRTVEGDDCVISKVVVTGTGKPSTTIETFKVQRFTVDMSALKEHKREGISSTELVLAFPHKEGKPMLEATCSVFAFLPLRPYGFKFIIQGDFLTQSSREGVTDGNQWNRQLRDNIAPAFVQSIRALCSSPSLANSFLSYVPLSNDISDPFFALVPLQIITTLRQTQIIRVMDGTWAKPGEVVALGTVFTDDAGKPFIPDNILYNTIWRHYKDPKFHVPDRLSTALGLQYLSLDQFITSLQHLHLNETNTRTPTWFNKLYSTLYIQLSALTRSGRRNNPRASIQNAVASNSIFFTSANVTKSPDREFKFIHPATHQSNEARLFLDLLGVKNPNALELAQSILRLHQSWPVNKSLPRSIPELKAHISFLHSHWDAIWHQIDRTKFRDFMACYLPSEDLKTLLAGEDNVLFVDKDLADPSMHPLLKTLGVRDIVRICDEKSVGSATQTCTWEFTTISHKPNLSMRLLLMIKRHWLSYYKHFVSNGNFVRRMQTLSVPVRFDGKDGQALLKHTYLKTSQMARFFGHSLSYLAVANSDNPDWQFLGTFGVGLSPDGPTLIKRLKELQEKGGNIDGGLIRSMYRALEVNRGEMKLNEIFETTPLIYINGSPPEWKRITEVRWSGSTTIFRNATFLNRHYHEHKTFFLDVLGVRSMDITDTPAALKELTATSPLSHDDSEIIMRILRSLSQHITDNKRAKPETYSWITTLVCNEAIFHMRRRYTKAGGRTWFVKANERIVIPDHAEYVEHFGDHVDML